MIFRKAQIKDAPYIATYSLLAMEEIIYQFIGSNDRKKAFSFLLHHIQQKNNQYSYENCWVLTMDNKVVGSAIVYDGANLEKLKAPIQKHIEENYHKSFLPEKETEAGEIYIDSIGISPDYQGRGLGSFFLNELIKEYVHKQSKTIGLLVDIENLNAKKLYLSLGFKSIGFKNLAGKRLEHLQLIPNSDFD